jgi:hypothetical protein
MFPSVLVGFQGVAPGVFERVERRSHKGRLVRLTVLLAYPQSLQTDWPLPAYR